MCPVGGSRRGTPSWVSRVQLDTSTAWGAFLPRALRDPTFCYPPPAGAGSAGLPQCRGRCPALCYRIGKGMAWRQGIMHASRW